MLTSNTRSATSVRKIPRRNREEKMKMQTLRNNLLQWICQRRAANDPLTREIVDEKATRLLAELGSAGFAYSKSWMTTFLRKHGFASTLEAPQGPEFEDYRSWIDLVRPCLTRYRYKNLYHVDELPMYVDVPPENVSTTLRGRDAEEDRVTVLLCCNASGSEKVDPLVCGKFGESEVDRLDGVLYHATRDAWLTSEVFKKWLVRFNEDTASIGRKVLLMLRRTATYDVGDDFGPLSHVELLYFPEKFPDNLRPMRAGLFHCLKMSYRRNFVAITTTRQQTFKWDHNDSLTQIREAWRTVSPSLIVRAFRNCHFRLDANSSDYAFDGWETVASHLSFKNFVLFDDDLRQPSPPPARRSERLAKIKRTASRRSVVRIWEPIELSDDDDDDADDDAEWNTSRTKNRAKYRRRKDISTKPEASIDNCVDDVVKDAVDKALESIFDATNANTREYDTTDTRDPSTPMGTKRGQRSILASLEQIPEPAAKKPREPELWSDFYKTHLVFGNPENVRVDEPRINTDARFDLDEARCLFGQNPSVTSSNGGS